jgi:hypothetical protein
MHEPDIGGSVFGGLTVEIDALQERTETVPHPDDGNSDFVHCRKTLKLAPPGGGGQGGKVGIIEQMCGDAIRRWYFRGRAAKRPFPSQDYGNFVDKGLERT